MMIVICLPSSRYVCLNENVGCAAPIRYQKTSRNINRSLFISSHTQLKTRIGLLSHRIEFGPFATENTKNERLSARIIMVHGYRQEPIPENFCVDGVHMLCTRIVQCSISSCAIPSLYTCICVHHRICHAWGALVSL